ncbi:MAG: hypothetical protein QOJ32_309 [Frankiaceae bacterium]|jgi:hypothetical protein|nr:hypothetical protein [Frankiaceae bacterium]MDQ1649934.1 hypothetical protein [Frankiaceae bacterium]MDQ1672241.1 hypothetical protein [Frankiaceae bacterium]
MTQRLTVSRAMHDVGLAAWFGGSLNGAIGLNGAASDVDDPRQRARVANAGWARWTPFNALAIGAHLVGGFQLLRRDSGRAAVQSGLASNTAVKFGLTGGALAATAYSRVLGQRIMAAGDVPVAGGTDPLPQTPPDVAKAQKQLKVLQWAIPAMTGGLLVSNSLAGEQERPIEAARGILKAAPSRAAAAATGLGETLKQAVS